MKVLFICKGNWFRSQMAAAIYNKLTNTTDADSVGTYVGAHDEPEGQTLSDLPINPELFKKMESEGMQIRSNKTKKLTPEMLKSTDVVVSMAEEPYIPNFLRASDKVIWWEVPNTTNSDKETSIKTYDQIFQLVTDLIKNKVLRKN